MGNQNKVVETIKSPVGRLIWGSLYDVQEEDYYGKKLEKPMYAFGIAIPKQLEGHWNQTEWGKKIWDIAQRDFPNGQIQMTDFAWKITDGDSQIPRPNRNNELVRPCDKEGFKGNWVLAFKNQFAPTLCDASDMKSVKILTQPGFINCGDFVEVAFTCMGNSQITKPGVYLNPQAVAFRAYGERIAPAFKVDVNNIGFGQAVLPRGASLTPHNSSVQVNASQVPIQTPITGSTLNTPQTIQPHYGILQAPPPPVQNTAKVMTSASSHSYEQYIAAGWTDEKLIQHGLMQA